MFEKLKKRLIVKLGGYTVQNVYPMPEQIEIKKTYAEPIKVCCNYTYDPCFSGYPTEIEDRNAAMQIASEIISNKLVHISERTDDFTGKRERKYSLIVVPPEKE